MAYIKRTLEKIIRKLRRDYGCLLLMVPDGHLKPANPLWGPEEIAL